MPKLYIIAGCNGSGKTTASYSMLPEMLDCREFVNSDEFAKSLSPFSPNTVTLQASRYMLLKIRYLLNRGIDFAIETTLATRSLKKLISEARPLGYTIVLLYFWIDSPDLAVARVRERVKAGGHDIPENVIRRRYYTGQEYFFKDYINIVDRWIFADNSSSPFKVIAEGWRNNMIVRQNRLFESIRQKALNTEQNDE